MPRPATRGRRSEGSIRPTGREGEVAIGAGRGPVTEGAAGGELGFGAGVMLVSLEAGRKGGTPMSESRAAADPAGAGAEATAGEALAGDAGSAGDPSSFFRLKI